MPVSRRDLILSLISAPAFAAKPHPELALAGGTIFPSPTSPPIPEAVVILRDGNIAAAGPLAKTKIPPKALVVDCRNCFVTAGFTNAAAPLAAISPKLPAVAQLESCFAQYGFSTLYDPFSPPEATDALALRAAAAGAPVPALHTAPAVAYARQPVTLQSETEAVVHPAARAGVLDSDLLREMAERRIALIPVLAQYEAEAASLGYSPESTQTRLANLLEQVRAFAGPLIFGTSTPAFPERNPAREYALLAQAGFGTPQILAALTTNPAACFGDAKTRGQLAPGFAGDVTVLTADPTENPKNFAAVRLTLRQGRVLFSK